MVDISTVTIGLLTDLKLDRTRRRNARHREGVPQPANGKHPNGADAKPIAATSTVLDVTQLIHCTLKNGGAFN